MDPRIRVVISTIQSELSRKLAVEDLALLANISASRLRHLFKSQMGLTPAKYIKLARMQQAETLLQTTFLSVKEIMNRVGISNESYFSREFKKAYGVAPSKHRTSKGGQS